MPDLKRTWILLLLFFAASRLSAQSPDLKWVNYAGGQDDQFGTQSAVDRTGNVYTIYSYVTEFIHPDAGGTQTTTRLPGYGSTALTRYRADGSVVYAMHISGVNGQSGIGARQLACNGTNALYLAGTYRGTVNFATSGVPVTLTSPANKDSYFLARYDLDGNLVWAKHTPGAANNNLEAMTVDAGGNVLLSGSFYSLSTVDIDFSPAQLLIQGVATANHQTAFLAKYTADGDLLWGKEMRYATIAQVLTDAGGNSYFVGDMTANQLVLGTTTLASNGGQDIVFGKYDAAGTLVWARNIGSGNRPGDTDNDAGFGIALDSQNNVVITGRFANTIDLDPSTAVFPFTAGDAQTFVAKYSNTGAFIWGRRFGECPGGRNAGLAIVYQPVAKRLVLAGYMYICADLGQDANGNSYQLTAQRTWYDAYIATFDEDGILQHVATIASEENDYITELDVSGPDVILTSTYDGSITYSFSTCTPSRVSHARDGYVLKFDYNGVVETDILSFSLPAQVRPGDISIANHLVEIEVNSQADLRAQTPTIGLASCASIAPASGITRDFSEAVSYVVTDKRGSRQTWQVVVNQVKSLTVCSGEKLMLSGRNRLKAASVIVWQTRRSPGNWQDIPVNTANAEIPAPHNASSLPIVVEYRLTELLPDLQLPIALYQVQVYPAGLNAISAVSATLCPADPPLVTIADAGSTAGASFSWQYSANGISWTNLQNESAATLTINTLVTSGQFRRLATGAGCPGSSNVITVRRITAVTPAVVSADQELCAVSTFSLTANTPAAGETGTWTMTNPAATPLFTAAEAHTPMLTVALSSGAQASLTWTITSNSCTGLTSSAVTRITNNIVPEISLPPEIKSGDRGVVLPASVSPPGNYTLRWTPDDGDLDNANLLSPRAHPVDDRTYTLTLTTAAGCSVSKKITVIVPKALIPVNTFTPNGDGINDTWAIAGAARHRSIRIRVYNRMGAQVYSTVSYQKPWDGTLDGTPVPAGTYFYLIHDPENPGATLRGSVTILR